MRKGPQDRLRGLQQRSCLMLSIYIYSLMHYLVADVGVRGCGDLRDVDGVVGGHVDMGGGLACGVRLTTARQRTRRERSHLAQQQQQHTQVLVQGKAASRGAKLVELVSCVEY